MKELKRTQFGNPILRQKARELSKAEIKSAKIHTLIGDMFYTLYHKKLGVGLAAPQVGEGIALAVIKVQPTKHRPNAEPFETVLINPKIVSTKGYRKQLYEGCISGGNGTAALFAKVPRYKHVEVEYLDETGELRRKHFKDLQAQIVQHEIDHLNGILFVDKVTDTKTFVTYSEYMKLIRRNL